MSGLSKLRLSGVFDRLRGHPVDLLLLCSVPLALLGVFWQPEATRRALAFDATAPTLLTAYASHFVHLTADHLFSNLVGYVLIVPCAYGLSTMAGHRRQFYAVFLLLLTGLPFALSLGDVLVVRPELVIGFSGVLLGFYGYLPLALYQYANHVMDGRLPLRYVPVTFFVGIAAIAVVLVRAVFPIVLIAVTAAFIAGVYAALSYERGSLEDGAELFEAGLKQTTVFGALLFLLFPLATFPASPELQHSVTHLLSHLFGYSTSFIAIYAGVMAFEALDGLGPLGGDRLPARLRPTWLSE